MTKKCPLCIRQKILINEHHIQPQATGGTGGPTIFICTECHDALHVCSIKFLSGKAAEAKAISDNIFKNKKLANELVKSIIKYSIRKRDGDINIDDLEYKLVLVFPGTIKKYLEVLAKDSQMGIAKFVTHFITNYIKRQFPNVKL